MKYLLGIDDGGSITKAALYKPDGTLVASRCGDHVPLHTPGPGLTERDMDALWRSNVTAIHRVLDASGISGNDIAAVSATGHGNGLYMVDDEGRPTYNAIISTDERAELLVEDWRKDSHFATDILPRTAQSLWPGQPPALLSWLQRHRPEVIERSCWALLASGFVRMRLTGQATNNISDASGTSLFNVSQREYDADVMNFYGIGELAHLMPPVVESDQQAGTVTPRAAAETGLAAGTPVAGGVFDIASSALASGLVEMNRLAIVTGTWSINEFVSSAPVVDPDLFMTSIYPPPNAWLITEGSPTSAGVFEWFINSVLNPAMELSGHELPSRQELYKLINKVVFSTHTEHSDAPSFLPFVFGNSAYPTVRGVFSRIQASTGLADILRSIYEGIIFSHMDHIARLERIQPLSEEAVFTGGIANSPQWTQMFCDATQRPLHVVQVNEAGTLGTVMAAAAMIGEYSNVLEPAREMAPEHRELIPNPTKAGLFADHYDAWRETLNKETSHD